MLAHSHSQTWHTCLSTVTHKLGIHACPWLRTIQLSERWQCLRTSNLLLARGHSERTSQFVLARGQGLRSSHLLSARGQCVRTIQLLSARGVGALVTMEEESKVLFQTTNKSRASFKYNFRKCKSAHSA